MIRRAIDVLIKLASDSSNADTQIMDSKTTPINAITRAMGNMLAARGISATPEGPGGWAADLSARLAKLGFVVVKDYHYALGHESHDCEHCDRPENTNPFVIPGTPLELRSSEGDDGRFRHWGGDDVWVCRVHPDYMDGNEVDIGRARTMDFREAVEHLAARDAKTAPLHMSSCDVIELRSAYSAANAERLTVLDASAPHGGHQG